MREKGKTKLIIVIVIVVVVLVCTFFLSQKINKENKIKKEKETIKEINSHYNKYVKTNKKSKLYKKEKDKYIFVANISKDEELTLENTNINKNTKYFKINNINYYISYKNVEKLNNLSLIDTRYKNYIPFNENIKTNNKVKLYYNDKLSLELNYSIDLPIIKKDDKGVYVEKFNKLYFVKNEDIEKTYEKVNNNIQNAESIPITVYHFLYLDKEECNEEICHHENQINSHFNYLKKENYFTINTTELRLWNENKINLPKKSILITIDDGARAEKFIPFLEKYQIHATLFLVTSWYPVENFKSNYLEIASHSDNLHTPGICSGDQGSPLKCVATDKLVEDLKISRDKTKSDAFCFPFYEYNNHAIEAVKKAGFSMAFIGGQKKVKRGTDNYMIPRITLFKNTTLEEYINYLS